MSRNKIGCELRDLIFYLYEDTLIPELFDLIGEDKAIKFIQIFGGMRIDIPSWRKIQDLIRNIDVYESLCHVYNADSVRTLTEKYEITPVWVREIYRKMRKEYPKIENFMAKVQEGKVVNITTKRRQCG